MTTAMAFGPRVSGEDAKRNIDWHVFGYWLRTNNSRALDKVRGAVYDTVNSMGNKEYWNQVLSKRLDEQRECLYGTRAFEAGGLVNDLGISRHLVDYIKQKYEGEKQKLTDKLLWNSLNNILRVLQRKVSNEPLYLLPKEDLILTHGFLERLSHSPPRDY